MKLTYLIIESKTQQYTCLSFFSALVKGLVPSSSPMYGYCYFETLET